MKNLGSMHIGWVVTWLLWSVAAVLFVAFRVLPDMSEFSALLNAHPEILRRVDGWLVLVPQLLWFVLGVIALLVLQASVWRVNRELGLKERP